MVIVVNINRKWMWGISSLILSLFSVVFQIHNTFIFLSTRLFVEELNRGLWNLHINKRITAWRIPYSLDCKTVRIFAYSSTREQSNKRSWMRTPRFTDFSTDFEKETDCFAVYLFLLFEYQQPCAVPDPHHEIRGGEGRGGEGVGGHPWIRRLCAYSVPFLFFFFFRSIFLFPNLNNNNDNNNKHQVISCCQFPQGPRRPF